MAGRGLQVTSGQLPRGRGFQPPRSALLTPRQKPGPVGTQPKVGFPQQSRDWGAPFFMMNAGMDWAIRILGAGCTVGPGQFNQQLQEARSVQRDSCCSLAGKRRTWHGKERSAGVITNLGCDLGQDIYESSSFGSDPVLVPSSPGSPSLACPLLFTP